MRTACKPVPVLCADARWRRGESVSLKTARDTLVPLELAQHSQMVYSKR